MEGIKLNKIVTSPSCVSARGGKPGKTGYAGEKDEKGKMRTTCVCAGVGMEAAEMVLGARKGPEAHPE